MSLFRFFSCNDPKKVSLAKATVNSVEKLTVDLQDTARSVSEMALRERRTLEQSLSYMGVVERMNILQREWATKVIEHFYRRESLGNAFFLLVYVHIRVVTGRGKV